jgi:hypothetical protein
MFVPLAVRSLLLGALTGVLVGCAGDAPLTLLESDVPAPPEMEVRLSTNVVRDGGELSGGRFVMAGPIEDLAKAVEDTVSRYESNGWSVVGREVGAAAATLRFSKSTRAVTVELQRRRIDPGMSSAIVLVERAS